MNTSRKNRLIAAFASLCTTFVVLGSVLALFDSGAPASALARYDGLAAAVAATET
jgi:hypothetical protein